MLFILQWGQNPTSIFEIIMEGFNVGLASMVACGWIVVIYSLTTSRRHPRGAHQVCGSLVIFAVPTGLLVMLHGIEGMIEYIATSLVTLLAVGTAAALVFGLMVAFVTDARARQEVEGTK